MEDEHAVLKVQLGHVGPAGTVGRNCLGVTVTRKSTVCPSIETEGIALTALYGTVPGTIVRTSIVSVAAFPRVLESKEKKMCFHWQLLSRYETLQLRLSLPPYRHKSKHNK